MKKKQIKSLRLIILLLGVAVFALAFLPALKYGENATTYTGLQVITGLIIFDVPPIGDGKLPFNLLALLAFLIPLLAWIAVGVMKKGFIFPLILFAVSAVLLFILPEYTHINVTTFIGGTTQWDPEWVLQIGPIIAGSLSVFGVVVSFQGFRQNAG